MDSLRRPRKCNSWLRKSLFLPKHAALATLFSLLVIFLAPRSISMSSYVFFSNHFSFPHYLSPPILPPLFLCVPSRPPNPLTPVCFPNIVTNQRLHLCKNLCAQNIFVRVHKHFLCLCGHVLFDFCACHNVTVCACACVCVCAEINLSLQMICSQGRTVNNMRTRAEENVCRLRGATPLLLIRKDSSDSDVLEVHLAQILILFFSRFIWNWSFVLHVQR